MEKIRREKSQNCVIRRFCEHLRRARVRIRKLSVRLTFGSQYEALKSVHVGEYVYDITKVLSMHPLMGNETYPFEYHPMEEYGCTSCHNGNGRGLTTDKAHGPVFDGQYEIEDLGPAPRFLRRRMPKMILNLLDFQS